MAWLKSWPQKPWEITNNCCCFKPLNLGKINKMGTMWNIWHKNEEQLNYIDSIATCRKNLESSEPKVGLTFQISKNFSTLQYFIYNWTDFPTNVVCFLDIWTLTCRKTSLWQTEKPDWLSLARTWVCTCLYNSEYARICVKPSLGQIPPHSTYNPVSFSVTKERSNPWIKRQKESSIMRSISYRWQNWGSNRRGHIMPHS